MLSPMQNREQVIFGSGYGETAGTTASWVGGGIAFLFLVFIILAAAFFLNNRHDHVNETIRERTSLGLADILTAAQERGANQARLANTQNLVERIADQVQALRGEVRDVGQRNECATVEAAQRVVEAGRTFGFRTFDIVHPNPCRHERDRESFRAKLNFTGATGEITEHVEG